MNITNYVVTIFKCEVTTDIQSSLKTALHPVLINEILEIVFFFFTNFSVSAQILFKNSIFKKIACGPRVEDH